MKGHTGLYRYLKLWPGTSGWYELHQMLYNAYAAEFCLKKVFIYMDLGSF